MIKIALEGYKGVTKEGIEALMTRGMKPAPNKPNNYYFSRDVRLKVFIFRSFLLTYFLLIKQWAWANCCIYFV
jgi:hypothetical protein